MKRTALLLVALLPLVLPGNARAAEVPVTPESIARRLAAIRQPPELRKWERIPWQTDLAKAWEQAKRQGRPIFLWVAGDDPLERC